MDELPKWNYRIYRKVEQLWFYIKFSDLDQYSEEEIWKQRLTHKKIVYHLFKLTGGSTGYYLVDIFKHRFYYCGPTLQFVQVKLKDLNGLAEATTLYPCGPIEVFVSEQAINPTEPLDESYLIYEMTHINRFRPYEVKQLASHTNLKDFAISKRELYQRFWEINGGQLGFYVYQPSSDEVLYFATITELRDEIELLSTDRTRAS